MRAPCPATMLLATVIVALHAGPAAAGSEEHCVTRLVPLDASGQAVSAIAIDAGCYATYAEALAAGSDGAIDVGAETTPASLSDAELEASSQSVTASVLIGTEWTGAGYTSSSKSYFASVTCSSTVTWEVSYVTDAWNDDFESGKGFGGCDANRKFANSQFGGSSILCTPNCSSYGSLSNEVSSLRWRH
jgi:hypothetical protein